MDERDELGTKKANGSNGRTKMDERDELGPKKA